MAHRHLSPENPTPTLDTTSLVHETYLKLAASSSVSFEDRRHFFAVAACAMRQILVDHARRRGALKRGGDAAHLFLDDVQLGVEERAEGILAIDEALQQLTDLDQRLSEMVDLRFFGGFSDDEIADLLDVSERTVRRDWRKARAFLFRILSEGA